MSFYARVILEGLSAPPVGSHVWYRPPIWSELTLSQGEYANSLKKDSANLCSYLEIQLDLGRYGSGVGTVTQIYGYKYIRPFK